MKLSYLDLTTTDPSYNLAMEQYVFDCLPRDRMYFMLWQNDNSIIVGKYQHTLTEINLEAVERRGIRVVRRLSGGGAVYQDKGNLNIAFITDAESGTAQDMKLFCQPVVRTLAALGVHAEVNGRNDITIDGKKFSGNSQYLRQGRVMHHGTIMFNSDLSVVSEALQVDPTKFQTKGVRSVRSRVTNVADHLDRPVSLPEFRRILLENILRETPGQTYPQTTEDLAAVLDRNLRYIRDFLHSRYPGVTMMLPQGTYMLFVNCGAWCRSHGITPDDLRRRGVEHGVIWQSGAGFGDGDCIRFFAALPLSLVREAMDRLEKYVFVD